MKSFKKALGFILIGVPNLPFLVIIGIHVWNKIKENTSETEMEFIEMEKRSYLTPEIKDYMNYLWPSWFRLLISFIFYFLLSILFFL